MRLIPNVGFRSDEWRLLRGRLAFTGAAGFGAQGIHTIATVTGQIEIRAPFFIYCSEDLAGALATIDLGFTGQETWFMTAELATSIDSGMWWDSGGGFTAGSSSGGTTNSFPLSANIILDVDTADITNGQLDFFIRWRPLSADGNLTLGANMVAI